jgi:hypothetical protein
MRIVLSFLFLFLFSQKSFSQSSNQVFEDCFQIILWASEQWKLDTLGCSGFRGSISDKLKNSRTDSVSKNFLFEKLGKPNNILRFYRGTDNKNYVGYQYFSLNMNCGRKPFMGEYVLFVFDKDERILAYIEIGDAG